MRAISKCAAIQAMTDVERSLSWGTAIWGEWWTMTSRGADAVLWHWLHESVLTKMSEKHSYDVSQKLCAEGSDPTLSCGWRQGRAWQIEMSRHSQKNSPSCPHCDLFYPSCKGKVAAPFHGFLCISETQLPSAQHCIEVKGPLRRRFMV